MTRLLDKPRTLRAQLMVAFVSLALLTTLSVTVVLTALVTRQLGEGLRTKAVDHARQLQRQLENVVAFDDRLTAREVFASLSTDPEVRGIAVYRRDGSLIEGLGVHPRRLVRGEGIRQAPDEVAVAAEVVSREGQRGTAYLALSTGSIAVRRADAVGTAVAIACAVIALSFWLAHVMARRLTRQLERITSAARRIASGDLSPPNLPSSNDEIGALAAALNVMAGELQTLFQDWERMARAEQERLARLVAERTEAQRRLEHELAQAQKLESVGRLASGVAHEINTPVQFVSDSVNFVREGLRGLGDYVAQIDALLTAQRDGGDVARASEDVRRAAEEADVVYVMEHAPEALDRALEGLGRVATIVRSMKAFAHPDQKDKSWVDLNQAIQSTLVIATNEYKYVADLKTSFGELPMVQCHVGEVNQVVLNLVVNAAHAIADAIAGTELRGAIEVRTRKDGDVVEIAVSDTGSGIPVDVRDKVFDPFFTTKEVGKGTGQGLAIARNVVVDKHRGTLHFESEVGRGTTFFVRLPIHDVTRLDTSEEAA